MIELEKVYKEYSDMIYRWLLARTGDEDAAEEITQETFYQAVLHSESYDHSCKVSTWLCSIAQNKLREYFRKNPPREELPEEYGSPQASAEDQAIDASQKMELYRAIHSLPEPAREIVHLRAFAGLSFKEIGDIFGKNENWARVTYYRARTALRKELTEDE